MKSPSIERLLNYFNLDIDQAKYIKNLCRAADDPATLEKLYEEAPKPSRKYLASLYSSPWESHHWRRTMILHAINELVGGYGVMVLGDGQGPSYSPPFECVSFGDPYVTTLLYKRDSDNLYIAAWGDLVERGAV